MKTSFYFFFFAALISFFSCSDDNQVSMTYRMTQCADPWMEEEGYYEDKEATLKAFLEKKDIEIFDLQIITDCLDEYTCQACTCVGCDIADVKVNADDEDLMTTFGFVRK